MASGRGLRTLSAEMAGYNPIFYHVGSVWPHDTVIACEGLRRYGLDDVAMRPVGDLLDPLAIFDDRRSAAEWGKEAVFYPPAVVDNPSMAQGRGVPQVDHALEAVVGAINALTEPPDGGPGIVLTLGGLVISGTIIPDWQWFDEVEHAARAAFIVHVGGSIDDEHGGWARLFKGAAESVAKDHAERRAAREVTEGLPDRYQRLVAQQDRTAFVHLTEARVVAPGVSPLPGAGMHWRGRLSEISGWSFGHLGAEPPTTLAEPLTTPEQAADHYM